MTKEIQYLINYDEIITKAMKNALCDIFKKAEKECELGEQHFVISFLTAYKNIVLSDRMKKIYPEEMTIVLQHQFRNLKAKEKHFEVELSFGGILEVIEVPYDSIVSFADPSVNFEISFDDTRDFLDEEDDFIGTEEVKEIEETEEVKNNLIDFDLLLKNKK